MQLEQQVCSLELAKKLKELGVKQESLFYWCQQKDETFFLPMTEVTLAIYDGKFVKLFSAFTVAELGEMLPRIIQKAYSPRYELEYEFPIQNDNRYTDQGFIVRYRCCEKGDANFGVEANTEANARAKMRIYLIENKLITT